MLERKWSLPRDINRPNAEPEMTEWELLMAQTKQKPSDEALERIRTAYKTRMAEGKGARRAAPSCCDRYFWHRLDPRRAEHPLRLLSDMHLYDDLVWFLRTVPVICDFCPISCRFRCV